MEAVLARERRVARGRFSLFAANETSKCSCIRMAARGYGVATQMIVSQSPNSENSHSFLQVIRPPGTAFTCWSEEAIENSNRLEHLCSCCLVKLESLLGPTES